MIVVDRDAEAPEVIVEPMQRRHLRAVMKVDGRAYATPWSKRLFLGELANIDARVYAIARVKRSIVGYGGIMLVGAEAHITTIAVDPDWQRRKIGSRLLIALFRGAVQRGCGALTLEVRVSNTIAQAMYRRFGMAPAGVRKDYYSGPREDALIMWAHDIGLSRHQQRLLDIEASLPGSTLWSPTLRSTPAEGGQR